ncbi:DUF2760 domain-containing protein [Planctomycetales bacterium 10988]|nr:DUF2760 domain-containing protein [Planctomycetales bacterium 10988]
MGKIGLAFRLFFRTLTDQEFANKAQKVADGKFTLEPPRSETPEPPAEPPPPKPAAKKKPMAKEPSRSEALTLMATLQREARFIDFLQESLDAYSDAQVKAAVLEIHRDCRSVVERLFAIRPLLEIEEGEPYEIEAGYDTERIRVTGNVMGEPPYKGTLFHHGWEATKCELPQWQGNTKSANVLAAAEVEV